MPFETGNTTTSVVKKCDLKNSLNNSMDLQGILECQKSRSLKPSSGFGHMANQMYRRLTGNIFKLNILVLGTSGIGKTTFLNTLFRTEFPDKHGVSGITEDMYVLQENDIKLMLRLSEYPEYGTRINNTACARTVGQYLHFCFNKQIGLEYRSDRHRKSDDYLVHVCLFFLQPASSRCCLSELDVEVLRSITGKVNILPIIAKADTMSESDLTIMKRILTKELDDYGINYFRFTVPVNSGWRPICESATLPDRGLVQSYVNRLPFAVIGGNNGMMDGRKTYLRSYPWGKLDVDNLEYSDTAALRTLLLSTHLQDLIDVTHNLIFETVLSDSLSDLCQTLNINEENELHPSLYLMKHSQYLYVILDRKMNELEKGFADLVQEKEKILENKRNEVHVRVTEMEQNLEEETAKFQAEYSAFIEMRTQFELENWNMSKSTTTLKQKSSPFKLFGKTKK